MENDVNEPLLAVPGFADLDSNRLCFFFRVFAGVLAERALGSFEECNELGIAQPNARISSRRDATALLS